MWYSCFTLLCLALALFGSPKDSRVWLIITLASLLSVIMGELGLNAVQAPWKLIPYGFLEALTINALYGFAWSRLAKLQCIVILISALTHLILYADLVAGTNLIYDNYEVTIMTLALVQLALGYDGFERILRGILSYLGEADGLPGTLPPLGASVLSPLARTSDPQNPHPQTTRDTQNPRR